jgi:DNA polymerase III subunit chi
MARLTMPTTHVEFHSGVADALHYSVRLLRKAWRQGARVALTAPADVLRQIDARLWTDDADDFVPHILCGPTQPAPAAHLRRTPLWLVEQPNQATDCTVLVNLHPQVPPGAFGFARVIDIVTQDDKARREGRQRWRDYEGQAASMKHLDQRQSASAPGGDA